jgi:acetate---CoA ligase (ADP-forming)
VLAAFGAAGTPVDVTGQFVSEPDLMRDALIPVLRDPGVDVGVAWLQMMDGHVERLVEGFRAVRAAIDKPFVVAWVAAPPEAERRLREAGIAVLAGAEPAVDAIAGLVAHAAVRRAPPAAATSIDVAPDAAALELSSAPGGAVPTVEARAILERFGVRTARAELVRSAEEAAGGGTARLARGGEDRVLRYPP